MNRDNAALKNIFTIREILPFILFTLLFVAGIRYVMDDAFITFVYSENLVKTGMISYNGIIVEGGTSFLYILVGALLILLSFGNLFIGLKIFSYLLGIFCIWLVGKIVLNSEKMKSINFWLSL